MSTGEKMRIEVELRARVDDNEKIEEKLEKIGAKKICENTLRDLVFGIAGLESIQKVGWVCRIREHGNKKIMDYKKLRKDGNWEEIKLKIDDINKAIKFLRRLGLTANLIIERTRHEYSYQDFSICIDDVKYLGKFIEVELEAKDKNEVQKKKERIENLFKLLDISDINVAPYGELLINAMISNPKIKNKIHYELEKVNKNE